MRLVVDANVFISALISRQGTPGLLLSRLVSDGHTFLVSGESMEELRRTLAYPRIQKLLKNSTNDIERILSSVEILSEVVEAGWPVKGLDCRDPKDVEYLRIAVQGHAVCIVSGDKDLLVLGEVEGIPILTPAQLLGRISN